MSRYVSHTSVMLAIWYWIYEVCPEAIQPCNMKNRDIYWRRYKIQETSYTGQWHFSPLQSRYPGTSHSCPNHHQLSAPSYFPESHQRSEICSLSKVILVWGKARSRRAPNLGCRGCWVTWVIWCFAKKLCMRCDAWAGTLSWWSCQSTVAHSSGLLYHLNRFCGEMFKFNAEFDADALLYLLSHFECDGHSTHTHSLAFTVPTD